jgi:RNA polymerase sigma-70 factor (ECF subfamily)
MRKEANNLKDEAIVGLLYERNETGLLKLSEKYEKLLIHIAATILGGRRQDIEECVNDTYMKLWKHIRNYDMEKASLKTYLKVIVRNTAINKLRDLSRREGMEYKEDFSDIAQCFIDQNQNVENRLFRKEDILLLNEVMKELNPKDRELVLRRYYYLQSSKDIAKAMRMTVTAVDSRLSRLRGKMKSAFDQKRA